MEDSSRRIIYSSSHIKKAGFRRMVDMNNARRFAHLLNTFKIMNNNSALNSESSALFVSSSLQDCDVAHRVFPSSVDYLRKRASQKVLKSPSSLVLNRKMLARVEKRWKEHHRQGDFPCTRSGVIME
jgi:hypothetical protein